MPKRQTRTQRRRRKDHVHVRSPTFRQVVVEDLMATDTGNVLRIAFGCDSPDDPPRGYKSVVSVEGELLLDHEMAKAMAELINDWLTAQHAAQRDK